MRFETVIGAAAVAGLTTATFLSNRALSGEATHYGGNLAGGTCSFSTYTLPAGVLGTALSDSNWDNAANCGGCVTVTGPSGNPITAMIVDQCPGCGPNHLDLFFNAFSSLADPVTGVIGVTWSYIDCPISTPLELHNKEGVSAYWFSMQVVNANKRVASLEVSTDGGNTWQGTTRQTYNFFENANGFGATTVDVKVTSVDGEVVVVNGVQVGSGASTTASANFGTSSTAATTPEPELPEVTTTPAAEFLESSVAPVAAYPTSDLKTTTTYSTTTRTSTISAAGSTTSICLTSLATPPFSATGYIANPVPVNSTSKVSIYSASQNVTMTYSPSVSKSASSTAAPLATATVSAASARSSITCLLGLIAGLAASLLL